MSGTPRPTILLTGATSGIGRATAARLAGRDVNLVLHGRNDAKATALRDELAADGPTARLTTVAADLASLDEVRALAFAVGEDHDRLDVLINNAGLAGGKDHTWTVNVVAPFLLAYELRRLMAAAGSARVVNVASTAQSDIDLDDLPRSEGAEGPSSYGQSKLALIMLSFEMARRWRDDGIAVLAAHPGTLLDTKMVREDFGSPMGSAEEGADVLVRLALAEDLAGLTGEYFDQETRARARPQAYDEQACRTLWEITAAMAGVA